MWGGGCCPNPRRMTGWWLGFLKGFLYLCNLHMGGSVGSAFDSGLMHWRRKRGGAGGMCPPPTFESGGGGKDMFVPPPLSDPEFRPRHRAY